jgi:hypothetical protein
LTDSRATPGFSLCAKRIANEKADYSNSHHSPIRPSLECLFGHAVYPHLHFLNMARKPLKCSPYMPQLYQEVNHFD